MRISDWSSDVCSSDLRIPTPCTSACARLPACATTPASSIPSSARYASWKARLHIRGGITRRSASATWRLPGADRTACIPLMVVVGAAEDEPAVRTYHQNDFFGSVTASSFRFGAPIATLPKPVDEQIGSAHD